MPFLDPCPVSRTMSARYVIRSAVVMLALLVTTVFAQRVIVHPRDTGVALVNPGMGWILYYYDDDLREFGSSLERSDSLDDFPGISVVYMRLASSLVEPREGEFSWAILDTPAQRWIAHGKKIALRFTSAESSWPSPAFATPRWVMSAGATGHFFELNKGVVEKGQFWEPDYDDPIYLEKLDVRTILRLAAERVSAPAFSGSELTAAADVVSPWPHSHACRSLHRTFLSFPSR